MKLIGNILWFILCGLWGAIALFICGIFYCITIIGIPIGVQCFKMAGLVIWPFGKEVVYGGGAIKTIANIIWFIFGGLELAIVYAVVGIILYITIIGIPFGTQCFKIAKLVLWPFGAEIV